MSGSWPFRKRTHLNSLIRIQLLQHARHFLIAEMTIREAIDVFDRAEAEELAVVEPNGTQRVVGLLNEAYALRRYTAASDLRRRELTGTI